MGRPKSQFPAGRPAKDAHPIEPMSDDEMDSPGTPSRYNRARVLERRRMVATLLLKEVSIPEIAKRTGMTDNNIRADVAVIMASWEQDLARQAGSLRAREVRKISKYERDLRELFDLARRDKHTEFAAKVYDRIHKCIELRSELQGLRKPDPTPPSSNQQLTVFQFESEGPTTAAGAVTPLANGAATDEETPVPSQAEAAAETVETDAETGDGGKAPGK